uniref:Alpha/beta hydrolase fold-3 domain-containing protein n=1 Tax=Bionectria ochroleuca TaxID=29856 RepID=A0A0B7KNQ2_BIOOC
MIADAVSAINWVADNVSSRIVLAGSSAGGFLAFAAAAQLRNIRPLAVLSVYGINDLTSDEYTQGTSIMGAPPLSNLDELIEELHAARASGASICEYEFPEDLADKRMQWISAIHEAGLYPELMTGLKGISSKIAAEGVGSVPDEYRTFFPLDFFLGHNFPPTVLLHGDADSCVSVEQSKRAYEKLTESGVKAHLELVPGKDHGFDAMEVSVDTDHENPAEESPLFAHLRAVLDFIDQTVKKHN